MTEPEPVLLLGSGRCGSTLLQMSLNRVGNIWIWGEHDGMLSSLVYWSRTTRESEALRQFAYPFVDMPPRNTTAKGGNHAAWLCPFSPEDIARVERDTIVSLLSRRLPPGKSRWGFKEIRYGAGSGVPERLFELFPATRVVHVVRDPASSIESCVRTWHLQFVDPAMPDAELAALFRPRLRLEVERWVQVTSYLQALAASRPGSVTVVKMEGIAGEFPRLLDFLGVAAGERTGLDSAAVHEGPRSPRLSGLFGELYPEIVRQTPALARLTRAFGYDAP